MSVNRIKLARVACDLTQEALAERIGVTRQTISLIEKGKYNPTLKLCLAICHTLDKTLDDLFWD
ncbi:MAG: helix-turn-helix transcriptional regulator [Sporolactobacillus sp.]